MLLSLLMPVKVWGESVTFNGTEKFYFNGWQREGGNCWNFCDANACLKVRFCNGGYEGELITGTRISNDENGIYEVTVPAGTWDKVQVCRFSSDCNYWWTGGRKEDLQSGKNYLHGTLNQGTAWEAYGSTGGDPTPTNECTFKRGTTIYLNLNGNDWPTAGGKPAAMFYYVDNANKNYGNNSTSWGGDMTGSKQIGNGNYVLATQVSGNYWRVTVPADNLAYVRFVRVQASNAEWTWNCQKNKLALKDMGSNNCVKLGGWDANASWENYGSGSAVEQECPEEEPAYVNSSLRGDMWLNGNGDWLGGTDNLAPHFINNGDGSATLKFVFPNAQFRTTLCFEGTDRGSDRCDGTIGLTKTSFGSDKYYFAGTGDTKLYTFTLNTSTGRFTAKAEAYPVQKTGWHVFVGDDNPTEVGTITEEDGLVIENLAAGSYNMYITDGSANPIWGINKFGGLYIDKTNSDVAWATQRVYYDATKFSATEFPIRGTKDATGRFKLNEASTIRIAFDGGKITINKVAAPEPVDDDYFVFGAGGTNWVTGWSTAKWNEDYRMTADGAVASKTFYNVKGDCLFKVWKKSNDSQLKFNAVNNSRGNFTCVLDGTENIKLPLGNTRYDVTVCTDGVEIWVNATAHKTFGTNYVLTGDFNGWNNTKLPLTKIDDYTATITHRFSPQTYAGQQTCDNGKTQRLKIVKSGDWGTQIYRPNIHEESSNFVVGDDSCNPDNDKPRICVKVTQPTDVTFTIWKNSNDQMKVSIQAVPVQMRTVKFYDGTSELESLRTQVETGTKVTKPTDPTKSEFTFRGWYTDQECTSAFDFDNTNVTADLNLYAKWEVATLETATLNKSALTLYVGGDAETLVGGATPAGVSVTGQWSVSPAGIVTVDNGVVTPVSAGKATITYTVTDKFGNTQSATCTVSVQACQMTNGTRQWDEYNTAGMFNNATIKLKFNDGYYMHVVDGAPKMLQSEAETAEWREIPTGETFSPAWTGNSYPLFYLKHVETGKYLCRGNGQYGQNSDWYYYVTTLVDEPTGNDCLWFYDTTAGLHLVCREGSGSTLNKAFVISVTNAHSENNSFNEHGAKPQVVCHYSSDPSGNIWTKLATVAWTRSTNPGDAGMTLGADVTRMIDGNTITDHVATWQSGAEEIFYLSSDPAVATVDRTTGIVTPLTAGQTTITATLAADGCYKGDSKSYKLTLFDGYYVSSNIGDRQWASDQYRMTEADGAYTYTLTNLAANTEHQFKVTTGAWNTDGGLEYDYTNLDDPRKGKAFYKDNNGNICFRLAETGDVTITYNSGVLTITTSAKLIDPKLKLFGGQGDGFNGYDMYVSADGATCAHTIYMGANQQFNFKIKDEKISGNGAWLTNVTTTGMSRSNCTDWTFSHVSDDADKCYLKTDNKGDYTFTFRYDGNKVSITYPEAVAQLQEAIDDATEGEHIYVITDYAEDITVDKTITLHGNDHTIGDLTVTSTGELDMTGALTVNNLYIHADDAQHISAQVANAGHITVTGNIYLDLLLIGEPGGTLSEDDATYWYYVSLPFDASATQGVYTTSGTQQVCGADYDVWAYDGHKRATTGNGWTRTRGTLMAGQAYLIGFNGGASNTVRFRALSNTIGAEATTIATSAYASANSKDADWNALGNPLYRHMAIASGKNLQAYDNTLHKFVPYGSDDINFVVGTPFFYQGTDELSIVAANSHNAAWAPARSAAADRQFRFCVQIAEEGNDRMDDQLYVVASTDATTDYQQGRDMAAFNASSTRAALISLSNYGMKLSVEDAPLMANQATYQLNITAPRAGEYVLRQAKEVEGAELYLTHNGRPIWNLTMSEYYFSLDQGDAAGYGLLINATQQAPSVTTGLDSAVDADDQPFHKILINGILYLRRGAAVYTVTGQKVM